MSAEGPASSPACPISGTRDVSHLGRWSVRRRVRAWRWLLGIDVSSSFRGMTHFGLYRSGEGVDFFHPAAEAGPEVYAKLHRFRAYNPPDKFEYRWAASRISPGARVADLGPGAGHFGAFVPTEPLMAPDRGGFDVLCAFQVLEHAADPLGLLRQAKRCAPTLILGVPSHDSYLSQAPDVLLDAPPHHLTRWRDHGLRRLLEVAGWRVQEMAAAPLEGWERPLFELTRWTAGGRVAADRGATTVLRARAA